MILQEIEHMELITSENRGSVENSIYVRNIQLVLLLSFAKSEY